jgi:hypothetical protein
MVGRMIAFSNGADGYFTSMEVSRLRLVVDRQIFVGSCQWLN